MNELDEKNGCFARAPWSTLIFVSQIPAWNYRGG
jgi:hypothetical protein